MRKLKYIFKQIILGVKASNYYYENISQHPKM